MKIQSIILFLITGVLFFSCTKEEIDDKSEYTDGEATRITLSLKSERQQLTGQQGMAQTNRAMQFPYGVPTAGSMIDSKSFSPKDESLITNVHILVFNSTGQIASNTYIDKLNFSETAKIVTETYCGENMDVWVVANGDVNDTEETHLKTELEKVKNINDLQAILISTKEDGLSRTDRLTMVGSTTITITPNMESISIQMHYLAAKVTVTVTDNTPANTEITITGWDVVNIPNRTYLKERTKEDAVNGTESNNYISSAKEYLFETIGSDTKTWGQSFYLFENRRGKRVDRALPTNPSERYPEMSVNDDNQRGKAWYAPPGATYMLIYGTYNKSGQMNNVVYKIYLGENPVNDYNIKRGKHYKYNVNVNGLNDIHIDTNIDWGTSNFTVQFGENLNMDAHPDYRVFRIGGIATDKDTPAYATIEVLGVDGNPCDWLALSPMNIYRHAIKQSGNINQPFEQEAVGCYVRTMYSNTITDELTLADATYRMARRITHIPFNQITVSTHQDVIIYADELEDSNGERRGKVKITYYKGADADIVAGVQNFEVTQQGPIKISDDLYVERYEESAMYLHPDPNFGAQNTSTMQWGHNDGNMLYTLYDRFCNGNFLTANVVYKTVAARDGMNAPKWTTATYNQYYRATYPRNGSPISEPSGTTTTGYPYYYPNLTVSTPPTDYYHSIYNSSAARYCHEKNRDKNGDGIIDASETVWYLPSYSDMGAILTANSLTPNPLKGIYWSSTEADANQGWAFFFDADPIPNGRNKYDKTTSQRVRCVRGAGTVMKEPGINSTATIGVGGSNYGSKLNIQDDSAFERLWSVTSNAPDWLKIATDGNGAGAATTQNGMGAKTLYAYAEENVTGNQRIGTIILTRQGTTATTTTQVTQGAYHPLLVNKTSIELLGIQNESFNIKETNLPRPNEPWIVSSNQTWLSISNTDQSTSTQSMTGKGDAILYAYSTSPNNTSKDRTAIITISRIGMTNKTITVVQKSPPYFPARHKGWAGSNIRWNSIANCLTFDDVGVTTGENYQGLVFYWGSLVALSPAYPYDASKAIVWAPNLVANPNAIPTATPYANIDPKRHSVLEVHDPKNNIGDICRYMTEMGLAPGAKQGKKWRLPTSDECNDFIIGSTPPKDFSRYPNSNTNTTRWGQEIIPKGRLKVSPHGSLPANGWFELPNGLSGSSYGWWVGHAGSYWTGTPYTLTETVMLSFDGSSNAAGYMVARSLKHLAGVRCVLEP